VKCAASPIICGGTGFYVSALVDKLELPAVPPNAKLRKQLEKKSVRELLDILKKRDPKTARRIDAKNPRRLIRAIEIVHALGGVPPRSTKSPYDPLFIGIDLPKEKLAQQIHSRLLARMKKGMLEEVKKLRNNGLSKKRLDDLGLEYRFCSRHLDGKLTKKELLTQLEAAIRHYAKRQMTWFKKDKRIHWIPHDEKKVNRLVRQFLK
jgi:tRNA dimethylallyltransferase